jgi:hypothetical protein
MKHGRMATLVLLCLLGVSMPWLSWRPTAQPIFVSASSRDRLSAGSPCAAALREARARWMQVARKINDKRDALEAWDPQAVSESNQEPLRRELMAADGGADLRQAREASRRAVALAGTPEEIYRATELLARIDCASGRHEEELQLAKQLIALAPRRVLSVMVLRRAAECNGLHLLSEQAEATLAELRAVGR